MAKHGLVWRILMTLSVILAIGNNASAQAQTTSVAESLLEAMTPAERIGQLFIVGFDGTDVSEESQIYDLITEYDIGGVVLLAENNNFTSEKTITQAQQMIRSLQEAEWSTSSGDINVEDPASTAFPVYVPLFIGLKQIGNGFPEDQILSGLTPLPSQMSIGATWDVDYANEVGAILGDELNTLGINLYLGPNLDVLETASNEAASALGVNTYGGDPFWVGEMGKAFISGVHTGSEDRVLVVAKNFPGTGSSDRFPDSEVATVRKSIEQLQQMELAPYFAVTSPEVEDAARVDAVMVEHIRYQGFQGNIRETTRPISFDPNALQAIMTLPQFSTWKENGGIVISDNLGSVAIRRFFDPNDINFEASQVARNAFLAGNDILYLNNFIASGDEDPFSTLVDTLALFLQKYREDSAFAQRVDASVLKILTAKFKAYGAFEVANVIDPLAATIDPGQSQDVISSIAQNAVTSINPSAQELDAVLPSPPQRYEGIISFTDVRTVRQCQDCPLMRIADTNSFRNALVNLYGPQAGNQILPAYLSSYSFSQLVDFLDQVENPANEFLQQNIEEATWVIFNTLDLNEDYPGSFALQRVLADRPELLNGKNVIVFAMGLPTYLDSTDISKVTAYYALYSQTSPFLDVAARVLMQELVPPGALPISLSSVGYDLISMTAPDPDQVIELSLSLPNEEPGEEPTETPDITVTPEAPAVPSFNIGDTITIMTGQIYDHNRNVVPDDTVVRFNFRISGEPGVTQQFETTTTDGVAYFNYLIEAAGNLEISAVSEPATQSEILQISISPEGDTVVIAYTPTPRNTPTPTVTVTPTPTETPTPTATPEPVRNSFPTLGEWALGLIVMAVGAGLTYFVGFYWWGTPRWALRSAMCSLIGGLLTYSYLNLGLEGTQYWIEQSGTAFVIEMVVVGLLIGWIVALIWWIRTAGRYPARNRR